MKTKQYHKGSAITGAKTINPQLVNESGILSSSGRKVHGILDASRAMVGTLPILRAFAGDQTDLVSPYVLFDEFGPVTLNPGTQPLRVDAHPHAGVTPTTYLLSGSGHHKDSLNYDFQIGKGDFMMFSSGRGAIHMEETGKKLFDEGGVHHGFQIWLNTPSKYKFSDPTTTVYREDHMATIEKDGYAIKVVLGHLWDARSSIELLSPAFYLHVKMKPGTRLDIPTDPTHNAFIYMVSGSVELEGHRELKANQLALYDRGTSDINLFSKDGAELLVLGGEPLHETVFSWGPFVMNNEHQIRQCIMDYQLGRMGDPDVVNQ